MVGDAGDRGPIPGCAKGKDEPRKKVPIANDAPTSLVLSRGKSSSASKDVHAHNLHLVPIIQYSGPSLCSPHYSPLSLGRNLCSNIHLAPVSLSLSTLELTISLGPCVGRYDRPAAARTTASPRVPPSCVDYEDNKHCPTATTTTWLPLTLRHRVPLRQTLGAGQSRSVLSLSYACPLPQACSAYEQNLQSDDISNGQKMW